MSTDVKEVKAPTKKAAKVVKVTAYQTNVLSINRALKTETKTLNGALKILWMFREEIEMTESMAKLIKAIKEDKVIYHEFRKNCRVSKAGNYSPFFVLQAIHKARKQDQKEPTQNLTPLTEKTVKELKEIAKINNVGGYSKLKKDELIAVLTKDNKTLIAKK